MKRLVVSFLAVGALLVGLIPEAHAGESFAAGVNDVAFDPNPISPSIGQLILWHNFGVSDHNAFQTGPFQLFFTGNIPSGADGPGTVNFAGTWPYECTIHGFTGTVRVGVLVTPAGGSSATVFDIEWASKGPESGVVNKVQVRRNGGAWTTEFRGRGQGMTDQFPAGTWEIRSRLENKKHPKAKHSAWSPLTTIPVT